MNENKGVIQKCIAFGITAFLVIACSIVFYFCFDRIVGLRSFVSKIIGILMPIIWGMAIAYLLNPVYNGLHRWMYPLWTKKVSEEKARKYSKTLSITCSLLILLLVLYALVAMIVPQLITSITSIVGNIPDYVSSVRDWLAMALEKYPSVKVQVISAYNSVTNYVVDRLDSDLNLEGISTDYLQDILPNVLSVLSNVSAGLIKIFTFLKNFIIGIIIAIYVLASKKTMSAHGKKLLYTVFRRNTANMLLELCQYAHRVMSAFISGKLIDSLIIGLICFAGCAILRIPYALLISCIIGITNIIPFFGPFIGAIPSAFFVLLNSPMKCIVFIIFVLLLQQFDGNILGPKIIGDSTGLSSFWVIFALLLFGGLFGVVGMLVGVPIFAVLYHIVDMISSHLLKRKDLSSDTEDYVLLTNVDDEGYHKMKDPSYVRRDDMRAKENSFEEVFFRLIGKALAWLWNKLRQGMKQLLQIIDNRKH